MWDLTIDKERERSRQGLTEEHRAKSRKTTGDNTGKRRKSRTSGGQRLARDGGPGRSRKGDGRGTEPN